MIKVDKIIVVEGKYDKIKLSSIVDGIIVETDGFAIFKDKEKQKMLRNLAAKKGIVILTDSDSAGFVIRNFLTSIIPNEHIVNAYIPDVFGKEKRKEAYSKEGKLGVEGVKTEIITDALLKAGVSCNDTTDDRIRRVTNMDLFEDGLSGAPKSKFRRLQLLKYLDLPERMSQKALIDIVNSFMTFDEYKQAVENSKEVVL